MMKTMRKKRIAVAGSTSAVGRYLIEELKTEYDFIRISRHKNQTDIYTDLSNNLNTIILPENVDLLLILSAVTKANNDKEILHLFDVNVQGTLKLCIRAKEKGIKKIIYLSSISALSNIYDMGFGYYAISKKNAEDVIKYYCMENEIPLCILRPSQIYGDSMSFKKNQPFFYHILEKAWKGEDIYIYGTNDALRNYIYITDLITVLQNIIEKGVTGTYSVISPQYVRLSEIAKTAVTIFESPSKIAFLNDKPSIKDLAHYAVGDIYSILEIDAKQVISLERGMQLIKDNLFSSLHL